MRRKSPVAALAMLALGLLAAPAAHAADIPAKTAPPAPAAPAPVDTWRFQLTLYGWATALDGKLGVRGLPPVNTNVSFSDILKNLDGAFMGAFTAQNDTWMVLGDLVASQLTARKTLDRVVDAGIKAEQTMTIASGYVGYRLPFGSPSLDIRALAGVRYTNLDGTLTLYPRVLPVAIERGASQNWTDPVVGVSVHYDFNERWFMNAIADVGGFGVGTRLSAQGFLAVGYKWTQNISTSIGYRALYQDYRNNGFVFDQTMHGLFVGLGIHF